MKLLHFLPCLLAPFFASAQQTSGTIIYEMPFNIDLKDQELPQGVAELLQGQKAEYVLYFNQGASLYQNQEKKESPEEYSSGDIRISSSVSGGEEQKYYTDLKSKQLIRQESLMGKTFLINTPLADVKWKFSGRQKKILDMPCLEAVNPNGGDTLTAWYTTAIPVSSGPSMYGGLPGIILELNIAKELRLIASEIKPADSETQKLIKAPTKGKKISNEAYNKLAMEKAEELRKQYGGNGNGIIIKTISGH